MKLIYVIIDGMGDRPIEELGGKTPLETAETPYMDSLANAGKTGLMYTVVKVWHRKVMSQSFLSWVMILSSTMLAGEL